MPFETPILAAIPAVFNCVVKGSQTSFELQQVPEQMGALFEIVASTRSDIINAREERIVLAKEYSTDDLAEWDRCVRETEAALTELEKLVEPARIDLEHNDGKIKGKTRLMWVIKDSKSLSATSHRLTLAHQRMSFAVMKIHMTRGHAHRETPSLSVDEIAPPPYVNHKRLLKKATDERQRIDNGGMARSRSMGSVGGDVAYPRPVPRTRTTAMPTLSRQEGDFEYFLHQHEQARSPPPVGPLGPLLASVEALSDKHEHIVQPRRNQPGEDGSAPPVRSQTADPSVSLLSLNRLSMMQRNNMQPRQRRAISPPITPPDSPCQTAMNSSINIPSELALVAERRVRICPSATLDRLPTVQETSSIRFELDASQEPQPLVIPEAPREPSRSAPQMVPTQSTQISSQTVPTRPLPVLPYPRSRDSIRKLGIPPEQRTASVTVAIPPSANKPPDDLKSTPHFFVGHRQPVNIRWKPEFDEELSSESTELPKLSELNKNSAHTAAQEHVYQPYRSS